jgi:ATP-binding cassette subfamily C (CFTR/MRP) protein 1
MASDLEASMVSVERVREYCKIENEAARFTDADSAASSSSSWPSGGEVDFQGVKMRYRPGLPLVLKGLDIHIPSRSKIGVVGRTGESSF